MVKEPRFCVLRARTARDVALWLGGVFSLTEFVCAPYLGPVRF